MIKSFRSIVAVVAVLLVAVAIAGCGGTTTTTAPAGTETTGAATETTTAPGTGEKLVFAECSPVASNQHQMAFAYGRAQMAKNLGVEFFATDANLSSAKQVADIDSFILRKVNGIMTATLDPGAATQAYKKAQDAGIPVLISESVGDFVTTAWLPAFMNTREAETDFAQLVASIYPGGNILVVGGEAVPYIMFVAKAMEEEAAKAGLKVLQRQDNLSDQASGAQVIVQDMLTKFKDVQAIYCFNDRSALGAAAAVKAAGLEVYNMADPKEGAVLICGMNATQEALEAIKGGVITCTYGANSETVGAAMLEQLYLLATGKLKAEEVPPIVVTPWFRWDGINVDEAVDPLKREIKNGGYYDEFIKSNEPSKADEFIEFCKTL
jgi:ribose transport system substrate-binding protein